MLILVKGARWKFEFFSTVFFGSLSKDMRAGYFISLEAKLPNAL